MFRKFRKCFKSYTPSISFREKSSKIPFLLVGRNENKLFLFNPKKKLLKVSREKLEKNFISSEDKLFDWEEYIKDELFVIFNFLDFSVFKIRPLLLHVIWNKSQKKYLISEVFDVIDSYREGKPIVASFLKYEERIQLEKLGRSTFAESFEEGIEKALRNLEDLEEEKVEPKRGEWFEERKIKVTKKEVEEVCNRMFDEFQKGKRITEIFKPPFSPAERIFFECVEKAYKVYSGGKRLLPYPYKIKDWLSLNKKGKKR